MQLSHLKAFSSLGGTIPIPSAFPLEDRTHPFNDLGDSPLDSLIICIFFPVLCFGLLVAEVGFFLLQILSAFFYLSKVLLQDQGKQTLRTSKTGQIIMAFWHLGSSFVIKKTFYLHMCYSCWLV